MMISPESYYETTLKEKTPQEIMKEIRSLKKEINRLKKALEEPWLTGEMPVIAIYPTPLTRIKCSQDYLKRAIRAYNDAGGKYEPTKAEAKALEFDQALESMSKLVFKIGGFFRGWETWTCTVSDDQILMDADFLPVGEPYNPAINAHYLKGEFISGLRELHIGEWKKSYDAPCVCDGTQWELEIHFDGDRKPFLISGSNAYPYNFNDLMEFLGIEWNEEEEEDEQDQD